jgi:Secretion system C-terminal sorting domain
MIFYTFVLCLLNSGLKLSAQTYPEDLSLSTVNYQSYQGPTGATPAYLAPFTENLSGNTVTRISDQNVFGTSGQNLRHNYSTDQPWNSDETLIKLAGYPAAILDANTYELLSWADIPSTGKWANTNPNIIYGTSGNSFVAYNVTSNTTNTLRTFSGYSSISFGYGEGNMSNDDRYIGFIGSSNGNRVYIVYDILNDVITGERNVGSSGDLDWFSVSASGNYAVAAWRPDGTGPNAGYKVYDITLTTEQHLNDNTAHSDFGIDANGNDVIVAYGYEPEWNQGFYLKYIRLDTGEVTPLFNYPGGIWGGHVSTRNIDRPGWAYISEGCCTDNPVAPREIFAIKLDNSNTIERFAKHHSNYGAGYGHEAQAVPNRDGTKVLFASNWNNSFGGNYAPAWIVEVPQSGGNSNVNAGTDQEICIGDATTLTATGAESYSWNTGETTASITVNPNITTTYIVTGTNSDGSTSTDSITVTVSSIPIANAGADETICEGEEITLNASGGNTYLWSNGATTQSITVSPSTTTNYTVIAYQGSCSSSDEVIVTVKPRQTINAGNDVDIYLGESTTLTVIGEGSIVWNTGETTTSIIVSPTNTTTYTVSVTETNGCTSTDEVVVNVIGSFTANAGADVAICEGESTMLTASGGNQYLWNTGEITASIIVSPMSTTVYSVLVTKDSNSATDEVTVFVDSPPDLQVSEDKTINLGEYVTLSASGADTYEWSNGATQPNIAVSPQQTTVYSVIGYINDCSDIAQVTVNVANTISAYAGKDMTICSGNTQTLVANGGETYLWSTGETTKSIDVTPSEDTTYTVIVSNDYSSDTDDVSVFVIDCGEEVTSNYQYSVYPNPTSDGILKIQLSGLTDLSSLYIHDTIGKLIYIESFNDNNGELIQKQLDISRFSSGLYFVTLQETNRTTTKKIIFR